jgi:GT2 family glycosyltransferase
LIPVLGVAVLNRPDLANRLLASIDCLVEDLVIIDNGGGLDFDDCPAAENVWHLAMPSNLGVAGSWNLIIRSTPFAPWWLIVNSDAYFHPGQLATIVETARADALCLSESRPPWACFTVGEQVVSTVGLFDERFHPAYCEDLDYERRVVAAGFDVDSLAVAPHHDNSSTIRSDAELNARNGQTYPASIAWHRHKQLNGDLSWSWSLAVRREMSWD